MTRRYALLLIRPIVAGGDPAKRGSAGGDFLCADPLAPDGTASFDDRCVMNGLYSGIVVTFPGSDVPRIQQEDLGFTKWGF